MGRAAGAPLGPSYTCCIPPWARPHLCLQERREKEEAEARARDVSFKRLLYLNRPEWPWLAMGCAAAAVAGVLRIVQRSCARVVTHVSDTYKLQWLA